MSADEPDPAAPAGPPPSGVDLARASLAAARAAARSRAKLPKDPAQRKAAQQPRSGTREPTTFGAAIDGLLAARGWEVPAAVNGVLDRWAEIVGEDIAAHAEPLSFADGVLAVQASSTAWATQLRLLAPDIVRRLNTELGHGSVLRIEVKAPAGPSWRKGRLRVQDGRGPRDTYG